MECNLKSTKKIIKENVDKTKYKIIMSIDGFELLYLLYLDQIMGKNICIILSDDNMNFLNGSEAFSFMRKNSRIDMSYIDLYIVTGNTEEMFDQYKEINVKGLTKPIGKKEVEEITLSYLNKVKY